LFYCIFVLNMIRYILYALIAWFLYNFIFRFIIPVYKTSRQMKQKFREMHQQMQDQAAGHQNYTPNPPSEKVSSSKPGGDYIDFEEVK
jgi:hypothetical protein